MTAVPIELGTVRAFENLPIVFVFSEGSFKNGIAK
jgi:hypothetical protein